MPTVTSLKIIRSQSGISVVHHFEYRDHRRPEPITTGWNRTRVVPQRLVWTLFPLAHPCDVVGWTEDPRNSGRDGDTRDPRYSGPAGTKRPQKLWSFWGQEPHPPPQIDPLVLLASSASSNGRYLIFLYLYSLPHCPKQWKWNLGCCPQICVRMSQVLAKEESTLEDQAVVHRPSPPPRLRHITERSHTSDHLPWGLVIVWHTNYLHICRPKIWHD